MMKRWIAPLSLLLAATACSGADGESNDNSPGGSSLEVTPTTLSFEQVSIGSSSALTFEARNGGSGTIDVQVASGDAVFAVEPAEASLGAGKAQTFTVTFTPAGENEITGTIAVTSNAAENPEQTVAVEGVGVSASVVINPKDGLDFGDVDRDRPDTTRDDRHRAPTLGISVVNAGSDSFEILSAEVIDDADGAFDGAGLDELLGSYAKAERREGLVAFDPAALGQHEGAVKITTTAEKMPEAIIPLKGRGVAAMLVACTRFDDDPEGTERCTPELPEQSEPDTFPGWDFGFFPDMTGRSGDLVIRNEGNVPLELTTFRYHPSSPDIRFWRNPERTEPLSFGEFEPVICPEGVQDDSCTHEGMVQIWVDYLARGTICCLAGEESCLELAPENDCKLMSNTDQGVLNIVSNDPVWRTLGLVGNGRSEIAIGRVSDTNQTIHSGASIRLVIENEGGAPLDVTDIWFSDPNDDSCGETPCPCSESSSEICGYFSLDPSSIAPPFTLQPDESRDVRVLFSNDETGGNRKIVVHWETSDPIQDLTSVLNVSSLGTRED